MMGHSETVLIRVTAYRVSQDQVSVEPCLEMKIQSFKKKIWKFDQNFVVPYIEIMF